jgi:Flp pilus assembly protein TadB
MSREDRRQLEQLQGELMDLREQMPSEVMAGVESSMSSARLRAAALRAEVTSLNERISAAQRSSSPATFAAWTGNIGVILFLGVFGVGWLCARMATLLGSGSFLPLNVAALVGGALLFRWARRRHQKRVEEWRAGLGKD